MASPFPFVFFNVKTTGSAKNNRIIQIAASYDNVPFNVYIKPTRRVPGLQMYNSNLYLHNQIVHSMSARDAFKEFMNYLKSINRHVILVAHNCFEFDMPKILKLAAKLRLLNKFRRLVSGFSDTLEICKYILRDERRGKGQFTLQALVRDFTSNLVKLDFNNALDDVKALRMIVFNGELRITPSLIIKFYINLGSYLDGRKHKHLVKTTTESLNHYRNYLPNWVINRMAKTSIDRDLLQNTYQQYGFDGIFNLLTETFSGRPRVTRQIKIIMSICYILQDDLLDNFGNR